MLYKYPKIIFILTDDSMMYIYSNNGKLLISSELIKFSDYEFVLNNLLTMLLNKAMRKENIKSFLV